MSNRVTELLVRLVGGRPEPGLGPVLAVIACGTTAHYALITFYAVWAIDDLGLSGSQVGLVFTAAALTGMAVAVPGGRLSDRLGRRPVVVGGSAVQAVLPLLVLGPWAGTPTAVALLVGLSAVTPVRGAALSALIVDVVPPERREHAFASARIAMNTGALSGPLLGAALVSLGWPALFAGVTGLAALALVAALRLPRAAGAAAEPGRLSLRVFLVPSFALLFGGALLAATVYNAFETLMPVSLTQTHGLAPAAWGLLFVVNPLLVMLLQLRLTRWSAGVAAAPKLALALLLMGASFLPLLVSAALPVLLLVLVVFVLGEMLWSPTADALAARIAPDDARGAYLGTLGMSLFLGSALAPALGLRTRDALGDGAMWIGVALVAVLAAALYVAAACRRSAPVPAPLPEAA